MNDDLYQDAGTFALRWPRLPYPGLRPFHETPTADESLMFYGRNRQKDEIIRRLAATQFVSVVGPSGCGKSSLVKVGVIHALTAGVLTKAGPDWQVLQMRPGNEPLGNMAAALADLGGGFDPAHGTREHQVHELLAHERSALWLLMDHLAPALAENASNARPRRVLLLIDQFEEIFAAGLDRRAVDQFIGLITEFFRKPHPQFYVIITMRADFIGQCASFPGLAEILNETQYITPVLRGPDLRDAIACPAEMYHGEVEPALVTELMRDMGSGAGYDADHLPLMQHALLWLWQKAWPETGVVEPPAPDSNWPENRPPVRLTVGAYRAAGRLAGILNRHADEIFERVAAGAAGSADARIVELAFRRLSERDASARYKRAATLVSDVCHVADCTPAELGKALAPFCEASFVERRPTDRPDDPLLDLGHESLIRQWKRLRNWADAEADKRTIFRRFAADAKFWVDKGRAASHLKRGNQLGWLRQWWDTQRPTKQWVARYTFPEIGAATPAALIRLVDEYRIASVRAEQRARLVKWFTPVTVAAVLIAGGVVSTMWRRAEAIRTRNAGVASAALMLGSYDLHHRHVARALAVAAALLRNERAFPDIPEAETLAREALESLHETGVRTLRELPVRRWMVDLTPDGKYVVSTAGAGITLLDTEGGINHPVPVPLADDAASSARARLRIDPYGGHALLGLDDAVYIVSLDLHKPSSEIAVSDVRPLGGKGVKVGFAAYSADGSRIVTVQRTEGHSDARVQVWNAATANRFGTEFRIAFSGFGFAPTLNADGTKLAVPTATGVTIYDVETGRSQDQNMAKAFAKGRGDGGPAGPLVILFHPTQANFLALVQGPQVILWDVVAGEPVWPEAGLIRPGEFTQLAFSPNGKYLAAWGSSGAWTFDAESGAAVASLDEHEAGIAALRFDPAADQVYTLGRSPDDTVRVWSLARPELQDATGGASARATLVALAGKRLPPGEDQLSRVEECLLAQVDHAYRCENLRIGDGARQEAHHMR